MDEKNKVPGLVIIGPDGNNSNGMQAGREAQPAAPSPYPCLGQDKPDPLQPEREQHVASKTKEEIWHDNHEKIKRAIASFIRENGRTATCEELAKETKLSRRSIHNHLKRYTHNSLSQQEKEQFHMLLPKVFAKIVQLAEKGDLNAVKLYFQVLDKLRPKAVEKKRDPHYTVWADKSWLQQYRIDKYMTPEERGDAEVILRKAMAQAESESEAAAEADPNNAEDTGNRTWENNHNTILDKMFTMMKENNRVPNHTELAMATGLSRQTIARHFREFAYQPMYLAEIEQLRSLAPQLVTQVAIQAAEGNIKAGGLFVKLMTEVFPQAEDNTQSRNYLDLNGIKITQESINALSKEYETAIGEIVEKCAKRVL